MKTIIVYHKVQEGSHAACSIMERKKSGEEVDGFYFWGEDECTDYGPYKSLEEAIKQRDEYYRLLSKKILEKSRTEALCKFVGVSELDEANLDKGNCIWIYRIQVETKIPMEFGDISWPCILGIQMHFEEGKATAVYSSKEIIQGLPLPFRKL